MKTLRAILQLCLTGWLIKITPASDFASLTLLGALNETVGRDANLRDITNGQ